MSILDVIEKLTDNATIYTVLIECEAAMGGKSWEAVLSDTHARKGRGKAGTLDMALRMALADLNRRCGGQLRNYL